MDAEFFKYIYEDGYDGVITKKRFRIGVRHLQMTYMFVCSVVFGLLRGSSGIAVLAMTDEARRNDTYIQIHTWDRKVQGMVLSSFLFGYALMSLPGELFLRRMGGKYVLTSALLFCGGLSVAMPTIANKGGWVAVCNAQFILGVTQACLSPANHSLLEKWMPPNERRIFSTLVFNGLAIGTAVGVMVAGMISEARLGWELIFYSQAMITISLGIMWGLLTASSPDEHQAIGDTEKEYIVEALSYYQKKVLPKPWRHILRSGQFWAAACAHVASNVLYVFFLTDVPAYLKMFHWPLKTISLYSMLPLLAMWLVYWATAPGLDWLHRIGFISYIMSISTFRKLINSAGTFGIVIGLTVLSNLGPESSHLVVIILIATLGLLGFQFSGYLESLRDMSQNFSGSLLAMTSFIASLAAATVPCITGLIMGDNLSDSRHWHVIFLSLASTYAIGNVIFTALGSCERQHWDQLTQKYKFGYLNGIMDVNHLELDVLKSSMINQKPKYDEDTI